MSDETILQQRIKQKLDEKGLSAWKASMLATGGPDAVRQILAGHEPRADRLAKLAELFEVTTDWLIGKDETTPQKTRDVGIPFKGLETPRNVPVYGTALGSDTHPDPEQPEIPIEMHEVEMGEAVDWLRRPPNIMGRNDIYGLYVAGTSMSPRYEPGDPVYVDPKRPPRIGDDVIVQLVHDNGDGGQTIVCALIKRLVRQSATFIELEQFEPRQTFRVTRQQVAAVHRVMPWAELVTI